MSAITLVTPATTDFIKDWPAQHEINCERIDAHAGPNCLVTHPLGQYTPILTALTTPAVLGGTNNIKGYYYRIFDQIYTWGHFRFGSGFSAGTGTYTISLPFKVKTNTILSGNLGGTLDVGNAFVWDDSAVAGRQPVSVQIRPDSTMMFGLRMNSGVGSFEVTGTTPITWAIDDGIKWFARYQRDPL